MDNFWRDAARGGAIVGAVSVTGTLTQMLTGLSLGLFFWALIVYFIYKYAKQRSMLYSPVEGFTYGQSVGFIMAMLAFAGLIAGTGQYIALSLLSPDFFTTFYTQLIEISPDLAMSDSAFMQRWLNSPLVWMMSGVAGMLCIGLFVALIVSAFVRRRPEY
ncbi:MAG: DUF4199 domain-containing protein [Rikenellaceae bacterium]|nr:DUF4199 domain-containing protein [Rikenellaceae bacterium]MCL2692559.1 DUF4199 domain-containing protein [Rikenellaceae bacterium]